MKKLQQRLVPATKRLRALVVKITILGTTVWRRSPSPTSVAAARLILLAVIVFALWRLPGMAWLDAWMPNIFTGLVAIAVTITFVERIIRREEAERLRPLLNLGLLVEEFKMFCWCVWWDYEETHQRTRRPPPTNHLKVLDQWIDEREQADVARADFNDPKLPRLLRAAVALAEVMADTRALAAPTILGVDLWVEMYEFERAARGTREMFNKFPTQSEYLLGQLEVLPVFARQVGSKLAASLPHPERVFQRSEKDTYFGPRVQFAWIGEEA